MLKIPDAQTAASLVISQFNIDLVQCREELARQQNDLPRLENETDDATSALAEWLLQKYMQDERPPSIDLSRSVPVSDCFTTNHGPIRWFDPVVIEGAKRLLTDHNWILKVTETSLQLRPLPKSDIPIPIPLSQPRCFVFI